MMRAVNRVLTRVLGAGAVISFTALICVVLLQVFARFLLPTSPSWTEEASRFIFIYSVAFAAPLALLRGEFVSVDIIVKKFSDKAQLRINRSIYFFLILFFAAISYNGYFFAELATNQTSPAMQLTMVIPYGSIAMCTLFLTWFAISKLLSLK